MLTDADITKFKKLYKERFNIELNNQTARHKLSMLVRQMEIVYQPITKKQLSTLADLDSEKANDKQ